MSDRAGLPAAERLSSVLREHGIRPRALPVLRNVLLGFLAGVGAGLIIGWLIWA